ncbi:MAG: DUF4007 family protein [Oscillochloris sp.]|nr:DUF4007 family protein [Oscillochloris sp.]
MLALSFNQKFPLERDLIKGMLQFTATGEPTSNEAVGAYLGINPYKVSGLRGWFCKLGLGSTTAKQYDLSLFGTLVRTHDPDLAQSGTLWLLHYFLSSEHEERSEVWYQCFNTFLQPGMRFSRDELQSHIERNLPESPSNKAGVEKDTQELIKTYRQDTALGGIKLITPQADKKLVASMHTAPDLMIVAYVLFDMWRRRYNDTNTLRLSQLVSEPETPGRIFVATSAQVRDLILHLQAQGLLAYADTQHEPVTRRFQDDPIVLLEQYYQRP